MQILFLSLLIILPNLIKMHPYNFELLTFHSWCIFETYTQNHAPVHHVGKAKLWEPPENPVCGSGHRNYMYDHYHTVIYDIALRYSDCMDGA